MDATITTDSFLADIQAESLQQLLTSLHHDTSRPRKTHISTLDNYAGSPSSPSGLHRGDMIEIQGPSGSGKSHLVYHLIATCILPSQQHRTGLNWGKAAIVFDTDGTFNIDRLRQLLRSRIAHSLARDASGLATDPLQSIETLINECLLRLHIFRPTSSLQLAVSLLHLPNFHSAHPHLQHEEIGLLAVDSMSSFYWTDRFTMEQVRSGSGIPEANLSSPLFLIFKALQQLRISHGPVVVITSWELNPNTSPSTTTGAPATQHHKQHLYPFLSSWAKPPPNPTYIQPTAVNVPSPSSKLVSPKFTMHHSNALVNLPPPLHVAISPILTSLIPTIPRLAQFNEEGDTTHRRPVLVEQIQASIRTLASSEVGTFTFLISDEDVLIDPGDSGRG